MSDHSLISYLNITITGILKENYIGKGTQNDGLEKSVAHLDPFFFITSSDHLTQKKY